MQDTDGSKRAAGLRPARYFNICSVFCPSFSVVSRVKRRLFLVKLFDVLLTFVKPRRASTNPPRRRPLRSFRRRRQKSNPTTNQSVSPRDSVDSGSSLNESDWIYFSIRFIHAMFGRWIFSFLKLRKFFSPFMRTKD